MKYNVNLPTKSHCSHKGPICPSSQIWFPELGPPIHDYLEFEHSMISEDVYDSLQNPYSKIMTFL